MKQSTEKNPFATVYQNSSGGDGSPSSPITRRNFLSEGAKFIGASGLASIGIPEMIFSAVDSATSRGDVKIIYETLPTTTIEDGHLTMVGVTHISQTFQQHKNDIRTRVRNAPFTFLEYFNKEDQKHPPQDQPHSFFGGVGSICAQEEKDVIVVNPETANAQLIESFLLFGVPAGFVFSKLDTYLAELAAQSQTRRNFLKLSLYAPSALTWASWIGVTKDMRNILEENGILHSSLTDKEKANILGWNLIDWRDLNTACGLIKAKERYADEWGHGNEAVIFQGAFHKGILEYIQNNELREAKSRLYLQYNLVGNYAVSRFRYDTQKNTWALYDHAPY